MFKHYLLIVTRHQLRNKLFSIINVFSLAIGIAAALLIMNYVSFEFSYDKFHQQKDRIYRVESQFYESNSLTDDWATSSFGYGSAMKKELTGIEDFVRIAIHQHEQVVVYKDIKIREKGIAYTEPSFFNIFDFKLLEGDRTKVLSRPNTVVITKSAAKRFFQNEKAMGKMLRFALGESFINCEVTGILEDFPVNSHIHFDYLISYNGLPNWIKDFWYMHEVYTYVLLQPHANPKNIESAFPAMAEKYKTSETLRNKKWAVALVPLCDIHLNPQKSYELETKGNKRSLLTLIIIAFVILITAWINYVNLTTARSMERAREVGIRKTSGASQKQLIWQYLTESWIVNMVAITLSVVLIAILYSYFNLLIGKNIGLQLYKEPVLGLSTLIVILAGFSLSGFYPAFILSGIKPLLMLKGQYSQTKSAGNTRKLLVIFQFATSLFLITGTFIVYQQIQFMQKQDLGCVIDRTVVMKYPVSSANLQTNVNLFAENLKTMPQVKSVTTTGSVPGMEIAKFASNTLFGSTENVNRLYEMLTVDYDFIKTFNLQLTEGRSFKQNFGDEINNMLINEESMKLLGFKSASEAIGKQILLEGEQRPCQIIGIVKNWHQRGLNNAYTPIMFILNGRLGWIEPQYIAVKVSSNDMIEITKILKDKWKSYFPESSFDSFFLDSFFNEQYKADRRFGYVFSIFTGLAFFISVIGLWALSAYTATKKVKEVGIRKVHGASIAHILYLFSKEIMVLITIAFVIAAPASYYIMNKWLSHYAFRSHISIGVYLIGGILTIFIAMITVAWQSWRVAVQNPIESLRNE